MLPFRATTENQKSLIFRFSAFVRKNNEWNKNRRIIKDTEVYDNEINMKKTHFIDWRKKKEYENKYNYGNCRVKVIEIKNLIFCAVFVG